MPSVELCLRVFAAAFLVGGTALIAYAGAAVLLRPAAALARWVGAVVFGMALASVAFHVLLAARQLDLIAALVAVAAGVAAVAATGGWRAARRAARFDLRLLRRLRRAFLGSRWRGWGATWALLVIPVILRPLVTLPIAWEGLMYRLVKPAMWLQHGGGPALVLDRGVPSWLLTRNDLAGGEVFLAWSMLPFHGELFAGVASAVQWLALGLALVLLARELGAREPFATATAGFVLALAPLRLQVGSGYVDVTLALAVVAAAALAVRYVRRAERGALVLACAAAGLAASVKMIGIPIGLVLVLGCTAFAARRVHLGALAAGLVAFAALAAPWLVYNFLDTGLPLPQVDVTLFGVELGRANEAIQHIMKLGGAPSWARDQVALDTIFQGLSTDRATFVWPVVVPAALFLISLPLLARRSWPAAILVELAVAVPVAIFFSAETSAWRYSTPESFARILLPALALMTAASSLWTSRLPALAGRAYLAFLLFVSFFVLTRMHLVYVWLFEIDDMMLIVLSVFVLAALSRVARRLGAGRRARAAGLAVLSLALLCALARHKGEHRQDALVFSRFVHHVHPTWVEPARMLDEPGRPHKIAVTHGVSELVDNGLFYFLLGSHLQNQLVYVNPSKDPDVLIFNPWTAFAKVSYQKWLERLLAEKVDYVVSFDKATMELSWMDKHPERFRKLWGAPNARGLYLVLAEEVLPDDR